MIIIERRVYADTRLIFRTAERTERRLSPIPTQRISREHTDRAQSCAKEKNHSSSAIEVQFKRHLTAIEPGKYDNIEQSENASVRRYNHLCGSVDDSILKSSSRESREIQAPINIPAILRKFGTKNQRLNKEKIYLHVYNPRLLRSTEMKNLMMQSGTEFAASARLKMSRDEHEEEIV